MGYVVICKDQDIWRPSLRVGKYFFITVELIEEIVGCESGITSSLADTIDIDSEKLDVFVSKTLTFLEETNNTPLFAMISGALEVIIALNALINKKYPEQSDRNSKIINNSKRVFDEISDYLSQ